MTSKMDSPMPFDATPPVSSQSPTPLPDNPPPVKEKHTKRIVGLVLLICVILFTAYFIRKTFNYYQQIQDGTIDLSSFEQGSVTTAANTGSNEAVDNFYASNFNDDPTFGNPEAKLTIVAFEDFQCINCANEFPIVRSMLNNNQDKVNFVFRDFPLSDIHPQAQKAAEAAQCAHEQGQFWTYHDRLFANQNALAVTDLKSYAAQLNLNTAQFDNCLDTSKYKDEVEADFNDGLKAGVTGTPTFFFNGNKVAGGISADGFEQIIEYFTK